MASSIEDASSRNDDNYNIPIFYISQHDSTRDQPLDELAYGSLLNLGVRAARTEALSIFLSLGNRYYLCLWLTP